MKERSNDPMIRAALVRRLLEAGIPRSDIRHEITLDSSSSDGRADLVVLRDDRIIGAEIKSGKDTLTRLAEQRPRYSARFDRIILFCDSRHKPWPHDTMYGGWQGWEACTAHFEAGAIRFEENYWSGMGALTTPISQWNGSAASHLLAPKAMLQMLWADEIVDLCRERGTNHSTRVKGIPYLSENFPMKEIRLAVIEKLRARQLNRWEERFWQSFDAPAIEAAA